MTSRPSMRTTGRWGDCNSMAFLYRPDCAEVGEFAGENVVERIMSVTSIVSQLGPVIGAQCSVYGIHRPLGTLLMASTQSYTPAPHEAAAWLPRNARRA